ncbi:phospholipid phosphatase-related protein type 5-like [Scophthalmus maximus]|uniref:phospholipid phosphatase-related protein type 5-like n=1 Tax=Scophthalmus maximus TaxID=52904 RepID=UPI001FA8DB2A|nr:phospholipid phosphatase-related protein type 5-like [Scophthalmus maximus]
MLYFQVVILAAAVMLVYYCEFTDTFSPAQQGFACRDPALTRPDPGPEQLSRIQPVILYSVVGGLPVVLISGVELVIFLIHHNSNNLYDQDKVVVMGDCCYVNPMVRRTFRFLGVYVFGLFATDILVNAGQLVTGSPAPYFLSVCQPNYTALGCQDVAHFVSQSDACTGDADDITRARKTFPSKEAALSLYTAVYLAMYVMSCIGTSGGRLTGPLLSLSLVSLAVLTGINRVAEYRNHWSDTIAGQVIGGAVAVFLVAFVVQYFKERPGIPRSPSDAGTANTDEASPRMNHTMETCDKDTAARSPASFTEVT